MAGELEILERGAGTLYGAAGGIWVMILHAAPTTADMHLARPSLAAMARKEKAGFPTLTWVLAEAGFTMDAEARAVAAEVTQVFQRSIVAQATLIEGTGFQTAAVRAVVTGLDLLARSTAPKKVFSDLAASVAWCTARRPGAAGAGVPERLVEAIAAGRERALRKR